MPLRSEDSEAGGREVPVQLEQPLKRYKDPNQNVPEQSSF